MFPFEQVYAGWAVKQSLKLSLVIHSYKFLFKNTDFAMNLRSHQVKLVGRVYAPAIYDFALPKLYFLILF